MGLLTYEDGSTKGVLLVAACLLTYSLTLAPGAASAARDDRLHEAQLAPVSQDRKREAHRVERGERLVWGCWAV